MMLDLAAIAPPDADMPPGFRLTNGAYVERDRPLGTGALTRVGPSSVVRCYEAAYERDLVDEFMEVQVIQFASEADLDLDLTIANWTVDRIATNSVLAIADLPAIGDRPTRFLAGRALGTVDDPDSAFPVCTVAIQVGPLTVRAIWHGIASVTDDALRDHVQEASGAAGSAAQRAATLLAGSEIPGVDGRLPGIVPRFRPDANFENYLHSAGRYAQSAQPADGFRSGYRRGVTESWTERGRRRRLIASDFLRFESAADALSAIASPEVLMDDWMLENAFIPEATDLADGRMFAFQQTSGYWTCTLFQPIDDLIITSEVWGYSSMNDAEHVATSVIRRLKASLESGDHQITLGPNFGSD